MYITTFFASPTPHVRFTSRDLHQFYSEVSQAPSTVHGAQRCLIIFFLNEWHLTCVWRSRNAAENNIYALIMLEN